MKVVVIGGGSSGVIAALTAKRGGHDVIILERNDKVLKKLLITGNGRCNYFNDDFNTDHYCSFDKKLLKNIINEKNKEMFLYLQNPLPQENRLLCILEPGNHTLAEGIDGNPHPLHAESSLY